jgi:phytoene desaturase
MTKPTSVIVIGGGIAGLASAALLARDGYDVTLLEKHATLGGRAGSWESKGFRFDTGPSWYLMPEVFDHFYKLLGTSSDEQLNLSKLDPGYRVLFEGELGKNGKRKKPTKLDVRADREKNLDAFEKLEPGSRPAMERYLASARDTYEIAKERFLYTSFEKFTPLVRANVLKRTPKLVSLLRESLADFAARHVKDNRLQQVLGYPAVFLGSSPYITPSMYHLMSYLDLEDGVLYAQGGFAKVIETIAALAKAEGVQIVTGADVTRILTTVNPAGNRKKARVQGVEYTAATGSTKTLHADIVVSAADLHFSETKLLPPALQTYPAKWWESRVPGPSAALVYLGVKGEVPQLEHHTLLFTSDWHDNFGRIFNEPTSVPDPASIYVCKPSATDAAVAPKGDTNLFILVPIPADVSIGKGGVNGKGDKQVEQIADAAIAQIAEWAGVPDLASRIVVRRTVGPADFAGDLNSWKGSALGPSHVLSQSAFFRAGNVSKKVDGLFFAGGSTIPGIGLPMCLISAEVLVKRLRGDTTTEALPEPLFPTVDR